MVTVLSAAGVVGASLMAGEPDQLWWWLPGVLIMLWAVAPVVVPWVFARKWPRFTPAMLIHSTIVNAFAVWLYLQVSLNPQSSTDGLVFMFGPVWQWLAVGITLGITAALTFARTSWSRRSRDLTPPP